jgi:hypothetical protein
VHGELVAQFRAGLSLGVLRGTMSATGMGEWKRGSAAGVRLEDRELERSAIGDRNQRAIIGAEF